MGYDGQPVAGPHGEPEECIMALLGLAAEECWAPPLQPALPQPFSVTA
jgi:hypothetical protein